MRAKSILPIASFYAFLGAHQASAQIVSVGVVGGAGLTDDFRSDTIPAQGYSPYLHFSSSSKDYLAGASVELALPLHLSAELDGLYRPLNYSYTGSYTNPSGVGDFSHPSATVLTWEFPLLAKYKFSPRPIRPFVAAGPSFRASGNLNGTSPSHSGITVGGGIEARFHRLKIAPQIRYTRWAEDHPSPPWAVTNPNQVELLAGLTF
jgi:hypothetical protein